MSLIERAVGRTTNPVGQPSGKNDASAGLGSEERESRIEQALAKAVATEPTSAPTVGDDPLQRAERRSSRGASQRVLEVTTHPGGWEDGGEPAVQDEGDLIATAGETGGHRGYQAQIDLQRLAALGMITPDGDKTALAEEFRLIKRPLIANAMGRSASQVRHGNLIMVTSAVPGEGKTFCAINLAMSMAVERDYTVLLVDADVARPSVHVTIGIPRRAGLMDVLVGEKRLNEVLIPTNVEKLRILPAGKPHRHATELLASEAMADLLEDLATRYSDRIVVFDSPPLLATSEARALATQMGQVVVVVEGEGTTQQAVQEALREIESCEIVGLIYNKAKAGGDLYGYYSYGYGKYGQ